MARPILNLDEVSFVDQQHGRAFECRWGLIGRRIGARRLGCRRTVVPPGRRAWPFHSHHANAEMVLSLAGSGADQIAGDLRYLAVSTRVGPEICEYSDSAKFGAFAGVAPGGPRDGPTVSVFGRRTGEVDDWDGEPDEPDPAA